MKQVGEAGLFLVQHERQLYLDETVQRLNLDPQKDGEYQTFLQGLDKLHLFGFLSVLYTKIVFLYKQKCSQTLFFSTKPKPNLLGLETADLPRCLPFLSKASLSTQKSELSTASCFPQLPSHFHGIF